MTVKRPTIRACRCSSIEQPSRWSARKIPPFHSSALLPRMAGGDGWRNGIYPFLHFHTGTHEVLGIARGRATVEFGGAKGRTLGVEAGDVVVLPAGTGHRRIDASGDLLVVGAYPLNGSLDQKRPGEIEHAKAVSNVANVPLPEMDPVQGKSGPLMELWK
jgi:uncharacterized protein YjlB